MHRHARDVAARVRTPTRPAEPGEWVVTVPGEVRLHRHVERDRRLDEQDDEPDPAHGLADDGGVAVGRAAPRVAREPGHAQHDGHGNEHHGEPAADGGEREQEPAQPGTEGVGPEAVAGHEIGRQRAALGIGRAAVARIGGSSTGHLGWDRVSCTLRDLPAASPVIRGRTAAGAVGSATTGRSTISGRRPGPLVVHGAGRRNVVATTSRPRQGWCRAAHERKTRDRRRPADVEEAKGGRPLRRGHALLPRRRRPGRGSVARRRAGRARRAGRRGDRCPAVRPVDRAAPRRGRPPARRVPRGPARGAKRWPADRRRAPPRRARHAGGDAAGGGPAGGGGRCGGGT